LLKGILTVMQIVAIIPARYDSTRFPGKPLAAICGKTMIQRVYENTRACGLLNRVVVATDSSEIARAVQAFGGDVCMTSDRHATGTDRIAEAARQIDADLIVNVQGDEPLLEPAAIEQALQPLLHSNHIPMGTLMARIRSSADCDNPNIVKVVTDKRGCALYFSRSAIPFFRESGHDQVMFRHIGLYVYRRDFLFLLTGMAPTPLEKAEKLEQLRALENGFPIHVAETGYEPIGVDVPEDIALVETALRRQGRA
jgi:3-deoxy-manno-octulosonate cytidylyltransferase (CMP-KDO synthetase)